MRPLDLIQPYRLEMGRKITSKGKNLYEFWGDKLAKKINVITAAHQNQAVINLASSEYFKAASKKIIKSQIVTLYLRKLRTQNLV